MQKLPTNLLTQFKGLAHKSPDEALNLTIYCIAEFTHAKAEYYSQFNMSAPH